jgi:hypothetical protein
LSTEGGREPERVRPHTVAVDVYSTPGTSGAGAAAAVRRIAQAAGIPVEIRETAVETPAEAERLGIHVSPLVRIDGRDAPAPAVTFACGTYG